VLVGVWGGTTGRGGGAGGGRRGGRGVGGQRGVGRGGGPGGGGGLVRALRGAPPGPADAARRSAQPCPRRGTGACGPPRWASRGCGRRRILRSRRCRVLLADCRGEPGDREPGHWPGIEAGTARLGASGGGEPERLSI